MLTRFVRAWIMQNTAGLLAAYVLYTPIAHGITGGHGSRQLSVSQLAAHSIALSIVGVLVATAQRRALQREAAWFISQPDSRQRRGLRSSRSWRRKFRPQRSLA